MIKGLYVLCFVMLTGAFSVLGQDMDSLKAIINSTKSDTSRVAAYVKLSDLCEVNDIHLYAEPAIRICEQRLKKLSPGSRSYVFYAQQLAKAYNNMGFLSDLHGEYKTSIRYYSKSLKLGKDIKDLDVQALAYNNLANVYNVQGNLIKAIDYQEKSKELYVLLKKDDGVARSLNNLGVFSRNQGDLDLALKYYREGYAMWKKINDKQGLAQALHNLGSIYKEKGQNKKAIDCFKESIALKEQINDQVGLANSLSSLGHIYATGGKYNEADELFSRALDIRLKLEDYKGLSGSYYYMGLMEKDRGNYQQAIKHASESLRLANKLGYAENIRGASKLLSEVYPKVGNYKDAYEMHVLYMKMQDSLNNQSNRKEAIQRQFRFEYEKKATADSLKAESDKKIYRVQLSKARNQRYFLFIGIGLVTLFSGFMYNRYRITRNQKGIIQQQKQEVDAQKELADKRRALAEEQKEIIEIKQKEILDSIHYAKRIQNALLTSDEYIQHQLGKEYFILYQPKDIVSGDFYWATRSGDHFILATADCTGHGVPGAFMSLLNINFLRKNIIEKGLTDPAQILNEQRTDIIQALNPKGDENSRDGMDCVLCSIDLKTGKLSFASANNPLWLIRKGQLTVYKGEKMPVGMHSDVHTPFIGQELQLEDGDVIYTFTDGYADQFGGPSGKKFKYRQLEELILSCHDLPMEEQRNKLSRAINDWKGDQEQVDDILIIGMRWDGSRIK